MLAIVCIMIAVLVRTQPSKTVLPTPSPSQSQKPHQTTLLVAVRNDIGEIADAVVIGTEPNPARGSWLSIQPGLGVDITDTGTVTVAKTGPWDPKDSANQIGNQLGAKVAGGFVMDRLAFAAVVDAVGGVIVDIKTKVVGVVDGTKVVVAKPGKRRLYGPAAANYAITLSPGEDQAARMARFDDVLSQVILKLPGNTDRVRSIVGSLGSSSRISASPDDIANVLLTYQTALAGESVRVASMPATVVGKSAAASYTVEPVAVTQIAKTLFEPSIFVPGTNDALDRIRVFSAGSTYPKMMLARQAIFAADFIFVWGGSQPPAVSSQIWVADDKSKILIGTPLQQTLGLAQVPVTQNAERTAGVQATVAIGRDFAGGSQSVTPSASKSG